MCRLSHGWMAGLIGLAVGIAQPVRAADSRVVPFEVAGDTIPAPLAGLAGNAMRGRELVADRETGNCLICHQVPMTGEPSQGDLGPSLVGVGGRLTVGQLRYRLVDQSRLNPATMMPPYHRVDRLTRVAPRFRDKPVFTAQDIEDVVAWLATLQD